MMDLPVKITWVRVVASAITKGTFTNLANVLANNVLPETRVKAVKHNIQVSEIKTPVLEQHLK